MDTITEFANMNHFYDLFFPQFFYAMIDITPGRGLTYEDCEVYDRMYIMGGEL